MATIERTAAVTEAVAHFALSRDFSGADPELFRRARRAVIDTIGVAVAGGAEPCFGILERTQPPITGKATVLPTGERTTASRAALLNGTAGHALDFDDVADELKGHPSVVLVSTLLALAEATNVSGREFLEAYVTGFEIDCAVARALPVGAHYRNGWHATATVGILGATAAAGRLLDLDGVQLRNALGIAASMAGGSRQNFGTMTKPLHAGLAARDAVSAVELAANGFTADQDQLEGPVGYFHQFGVDADLVQLQTSLGDANILLTQGVSVKKYPCCYGTHRTADATLALYARGVRGTDVKSVRAAVEPGGLLATIHHRPTTGLQGKFSTEYVVAACLLDGEVKLRSFTDAAVTRSAAQELLQRVEIRESVVPPFGAESFDHAYAAVEIELADGSRVRERCDVPRGDGRAPLTDAEIEAKFRDCLDFAPNPWNPDALLAHLQTIETAPHVLRLSE
jgi:2-methylcitrate dehydratase PrpD